MYNLFCLNYCIIYTVEYIVVQSMRQLYIVVESVLLYIVVQSIPLYTVVQSILLYTDVQSTLFKLLYNLYC